MDNRTHSVNGNSQLVGRIIAHIEQKQSVLVVGSHGFGKTTLLEAVAGRLGIEVNHVSEVNDPLVVGRGKLLLGDTIIVDEASTYPPQIVPFLNARYNSAVVATHHQEIGIQYVEYLTGNEPIIYTLRPPSDS